MEFTAIVDTREKDPWMLRSASIGERTIKKLDTGDYSIEGLESILCIERKKSVAEFAANSTEKRFKDELNRMLPFKYRFIILEFSISQIIDYPVGSNIPKSRWSNIGIRGPYIMKFISEIQVNYGINVIFAGSTENAEYTAVNIMKRVYERERADKTPDN